MPTSDTSNLDSNTPPRSTGRAWRTLTGWLSVVALVGLAASCVLFVDETEYVIVETLGRTVSVYDRTNAVTGDRGLHFKLPWPIGTVRRFDRRQQLFDPPGREMFTRDKKNITVSGYVCWRIAEPAEGATSEVAGRPVVRFFRGLGTVATAEATLDSRVRSILSSEIGKVELSDLLHVPNSESGPTSDASPVEALSRRVLEQVRRRTEEGIEIVDLRLKRINLPEGNRIAVYERMRSERLRIAERYRSAGRAERTRIESQAQRQSAELLAKADAEAERIRGTGEAEAIAILNRAHAMDPEFYEFTRTLDMYKKTLNERTTLVLSASSRLLKLLNDGVPTAAERTSPPNGKATTPANVGVTTPPASGKPEKSGGPE
ncbi:MAG: protease modulator HflC [Planctomycetales bacterium]|nr:protease modulator HflC [Planctomycetales bacterium]